MSNSGAAAVEEVTSDALVAAGVPLPLADLVAAGLGELADVILASKSPESALARAKQNALADAEDAVAVASADALIKHKG